MGNALRLYLLVPVCLTLLALAWLAAGAVRLGIHSPGTIARAPTDWWIVITVDPQPEDRLLIVEAVGQPGEYRRSDYEVPGARGPRIRQVWYQHLPEGCYTFYASLYGQRRMLASAKSSRLSVVGFDGDSCPAPF